MDHHRGTSIALCGIRRPSDLIGLQSAAHQKEDLPSMLLDGKKLLITGVLTDDSIASAWPGLPRRRALRSC
jgi:hypothetical protein